MYAIVLFILLAANAQNPVNKNAPAKHKQNQTATETKGKTDIAVPLNSPHDQPTPNHNTERYQDHPDGGTNIIEVTPQSESGWFIAYVIATLGIAGCNLGMLAAMRDQRKLMSTQLGEMKSSREQTIAEMKAAGEKTQQSIAIARQSADAASKSAEALVASERAWIFVDIEWNGLKGIMQEDTGDNFTAIWINAYCRNEGRTPAWLDELRCKMEILPTLPDTRDFEIAERQDEGPQPINAGGKSTVIPMALTSPGKRTINNSMIIYGMAKYRDMFGFDRTSKFGFMVLGIGGAPRILRLSGRPYTENT
jgi:hypothetical protein